LSKPKVYWLYPVSFMEQEIYIVKDFLDKTLNYLLTYENLDPMGVEHFKKCQIDANNLFEQRRHKELKRFAKYIIEDMTDNTDYLYLVKDYKFLFPKLLSGNKKVVKRILISKKIKDHTEYEIVKSQINFVDNPLLKDFNENELKTLKNLLLDFETKLVS